MDSITICREILKLLNQYAETHGLRGYGFGPAQFLEKLDITEQQLNVNIDFLEQEGYIKVLRALGVHFVSAGLTSTGRKLLMSPSEFNSQFPSSVTIVQGNNNVTGTNISISNSFNPVDKVIQESNLDDGLKAELKSLIHELISDSTSKDAKESKLKDFFTNVLVKTGEGTIPIAATTAIKGLLAHFGISI